MMKATEKLIKTSGELCKVCYTCVRDCPAKAIRISSGQAEVISDRCIGCGNCVRVCSQNAKEAYDSTGEVRELLASPGKTAAIVAPSFPAEFVEMDPDNFVAMVRDLGFDLVCEVSFGADIVAYQYKKLLENNTDKRYIATTCPGIVSYIEKYHPLLVGNLAPIASPMLTTARCLKQLHGDDLKIVFIGPCIAKKSEAARPQNGKVDVDAVLTFVELRKMFTEEDLSLRPEHTSVFDPPHPGLGALFPLSGGMLRAADMKEDLLSCDIVTADGKNNFVQAIMEFEEGNFDAKLLEILCCNGCIMGSGMSSNIPYFKRRAAVSKYVQNRILQTDESDRVDVYKKLSEGLDTSFEFTPDDHRLPLPSRQELDEIMTQMGKLKPEDELDCGACGYSTCRDHAIAIHKGLAENEMCLPNTIERLKKSLADLNTSNNQLERTKQALFSAEKLASMGQLSAGIAHEINNPLGVILLNASLLLDEVPKDSENYEDLKLIVDQAERCKKIVGDLLNFARKNKVVLEAQNICELVDHCLKAILVPDNIKIKVQHSIWDPMVDLDQDQIIQVLTNLIMNAAEAMPDGGNIDIRVSEQGEDVIIEVEDNGTGIGPEHIHKIFEPLYTTKQMGKGTGLGLAVTYGIIKMHRGQINVKSNADPNRGPTGTTFTVTMPKKEKAKSKYEGMQ